MKVLIVSSEPLHPDDTLGSTFELSQAKLLLALYDVAILSVGQPVSIRQILTAPNFGKLDRLARLAGNLARRVLGLTEVHRHRIEGIAVFEGIAPRLIGKAGFDAQLGNWLTAARVAFSKYRRANGLPDLVHAHGRFLNAGVFALATRNAAGVPYVYTEHSSFFPRGWAPEPARQHVAEVIAGAAVYSAVSPFLAASVERFLGKPARKAEILPNVVDAIYEQANKPPPAAPPFRFIQVSSLDANKGVDLLLRAFAQAFGGNPSYGLTICGDGPLRGDLEELASSLGIAIRFTGRLSRQDVLREIDNAHALVLASRIETFGLVLVEAMARGRPVIATRCGGPDSIVDEASGILVEPDNVTQLADALRRMARDFTAYDRDNIRRAALQNYGPAAFLARIKPVYKCALAAKAAVPPP